MIGIDTHIYLYNFLTDSKWRIWRHISLILILLIISFNQVFIIYQDNAAFLGNNIYWICLGALTTYLIMVYFNLYIWVPVYLLKKKYKSYVVVVSLSIFSLLVLLLIQEYEVRSFFELPHRIRLYTNPLILVDSLASFAIMIICLAGTTVTKVLKKWIFEKQHVEKLEQEHIQSEVEQLKEQIAPNFLSQVFTSSSGLIKTDPDKASEMLMSVGELLRYQLYDCSREKVLLNSEISFLTKYLNLERLLRSDFDYELSIKEGYKNIAISPLLFIPFVQKIIEKINNEEHSVFLELAFNVTTESLIFTCQADNCFILLNEDFTSVQKRLELLYTNNYTLSITENMLVFRLDLIN
jgi:hypothetical protein